MAMVKVFVHTTDSDVNGRAMALATQTDCPGSLKRMLERELSNIYNSTQALVQVTQKSTKCRFW